jgi:hypothetical protein
MNKLPLAKRVQILSLLCEGSSMRSIARVVDVSINTVAKMLVDAGEACAAFHEENVRDVQSKRVQVDEIWSFCAAKQKNFPNMKKPVDGAGDVWTWTALDADSKLIVQWFVGGRDALYTVWYNWVSIHKTLRVTPAMAAGLTDRLMSIEDVVAPIDAREGAPKKRGLYKKQPQSGRS